MHLGDAKGAKYVLDEVLVWFFLLTEWGSSSFYTFSSEMQLDPAEARAFAAGQLAPMTVMVR